MHNGDNSLQNGFPMQNTTKRRGKSGVSHIVRDASKFRKTSAPTGVFFVLYEVDVLTLLFTFKKKRTKNEYNTTILALTEVII